MDALPDELRQTLARRLTRRRPGESSALDSAKLLRR
jgi:hypothetical protein